ASAGLPDSRLAWKGRSHFPLKINRCALFLPLPTAAQGPYGRYKVDGWSAATSGLVMWMYRLTEPLGVQEENLTGPYHALAGLPPDMPSESRGLSIAQRS
ncbi:Hypothetical predicted protein, partial [Marmota monax]